MDDFTRLLHLAVPRDPDPLQASWQALDKLAAARLEHTPASGNPVQQLRLAKRYSDRGMYEAKHAILRQLLAQHPNDFAFDGDDPAGGKYVGVRHVPSGFQIHGPRSLRPAPQRQQAPPQPPTPTATNPTNELKDLLSLEGSVSQTQAFDAKVGEDLPQHTLITGYSGAGKTTHARALAKQTGMPIVHLDRHPLWKEWKHTDTKGMSPRLKNATRRDYNERLVADALARATTPSIIEGVQLMHGRPELLTPHKRVFVDTPWDRLAEQRLKRDRTSKKFSPQAMNLADNEEEWQRQRIRKARVSPAIYRKFARRWRDDPLVEIVGPTKEASDGKPRMAAIEKPYRERAEVYALKDGKVWGGLHDNGTFGVYGGGLDPGERPEDAAAREFAEESGYTVSNLRPVPGMEPFAMDWKPPYASAKQRERAKRYKGSRTHYFMGDLGEAHNRPLVEPVKRRDVRLYGLTEALKLTEGEVKDPVLAKANASRRKVLQAIQSAIVSVAPEAPVKAADDHLVDRLFSLLQKRR